MLRAPQEWHWRCERQPKYLYLIVTWVNIYFSSVQYLSHVQLFATPWTEAHQASLSITNSRRLLKLMSNESVMPSSHLILCCPLLLLPSIFPSIRVFSSESALRIRWSKYWSVSFSVGPSSEHQDCALSGWTGCISLRYGYHNDIFFTPRTQSLPGSATTLLPVIPDRMRQKSPNPHRGAGVRVCLHRLFPLQVWCWLSDCKTWTL